MIKKIVFTASLAALALGCNSAAPVAQNSVPVSGTPERAQTAIAHNTETSAPPSTSDAPGGRSHWKQSGQPIETKDLDAAIAAAEVALKKSPSDEGLKKKLGDAYYKRAAALTEAQQYASALGDYRRALKNDPSNAEAKEWIDKIIMIYESMGRDSPKEGEEPPPLTKSKPIV